MIIYLDTSVLNRTLIIRLTNSIIIMNQFYKIKRALALLLLCVSITAVNAQDDNTSFSVGLTSDQFFGFAPSVAIQYDLNEKVGVSAYGIFWSGGTAAAWGNWTEFGAGVNLTLSDGVVFNPNLGFTFGDLLSKGATSGQLGGILGDGIVPNFFFNIDKTKFESEVYVGYYAPLLNKAPDGASALAYLHYWANVGYKVSDKFSFGLHFEHLKRTKDDIGGKLDYYQWFGPYIQLSVPKYSSFIRLSAGTDFVDSAEVKAFRATDSFFKLSTGFTF